MRVLLAALILSLPIVPFAFAEDDKTPDAYLCIAEMATGFVYKNDKWQITRLNIDGSKYLLRRTKDGDFIPEHAWVWLEFGQDKSIDSCEKDISEKGFLTCEGIGMTILINVNTLRYQSVYTLGYVVSEVGYNGGTPYMEIGKCSPI